MSLVGRLREAIGLPNYSLYSINDVDPAVNRKAIVNIKAARAALDMPIDKARRADYERNMVTTLPGISLPEPLFSKIREQAISALSDYGRSPCAYYSGDQCERQGIPRNVVPGPVRCYTTDVKEAVPELPCLIDEAVAGAVRSCIGSHFSLYEVILTRNHHVPPTLAQYDLLSDRWHFDHKYNDIFHTFVTLSNVEMADGPTHVLSAPDSRALLDRGFDCSLRIRDPNGGLPASIIESMSSLTCCAGPPGTIVMSHTSMCLHKAGTPQLGRIRDVMILSFRHATAMDLSWESVKRHHAS